MNQQTGSRGRPLILGLLAVGIVVAIGLWLVNRPGDDPPAAEELVASDEIATAFYISLAALDVEENERAANLLEEAVADEDREPALWANLAVARLRLQQLDDAREALQRALNLAEESQELAVLHATVLEHSQQVDQAIAQLRIVHEKWPENVAAVYSLVELLGRLRTDEAEAERLALLSELLARLPENLNLLCAHGRIAASLERGDALQTSLDTLLSHADDYSAASRQELQAASEAAQAGDFRQAALSLAFFENLQRPEAAYQTSLAELGATSLGAFGNPLRSFQRLQLPAVESAPADGELTFALQPNANEAAAADIVLAAAQSEGRPALIIALADGSARIGEASPLPFPGPTSAATSGSVCVADLNQDFQQDLLLAGDEGFRIYLGSETGEFTAHETTLPEFQQPWSGVWTADIDADGDLDLMLSDRQSPLRWIRNNGEMTFTLMEDFVSTIGVVDVVSADLDRDGDIDMLTLDEVGDVGVWLNEREARFIEAPAPAAGTHVAIAVGDINRDGQLDILSLTTDGVVNVAQQATDGNWSQSTLATWPADRWPADVADDEAAAGAATLAVADLDNNGALDVLASAAGSTALWLCDADGSWSLHEAAPEMHVTSLVDIDRDGLLDLVGLAVGGEQVALGRSPAGYGWHVIEPVATTGTGDQRINSFGLGGRIELRAGNLLQASGIDSPRVHFGLGRHAQADLARIYWPNGIMQAEFDSMQAGQRMIAVQRLKGSCPWVFTFNGEEFVFVKDFLWRSPLGLRIYAQTTAGVMQTTDWIRLPGDQLADVNGRYEIRITAELWETHFFDHVSLLTVDYPEDARVFVDERFIPSEAPVQRVIVTTPPEPLQELRDHRGRAVDETLHAADGRYIDGFALGQYQGIAEEHWVEFALPPGVDATRPVVIVGNGWIYPTDSSINVALGQGGGDKPFGLTLDYQSPDGEWVVARDNLGFPAGKNKDVVIELPADLRATASRFRLRTNMEIYWDSLHWSYELTDVEPEVTPIAAEVAELRYRGYSRLSAVNRRRPDVPFYEVAATGQRWLDLEGYYTRFGDVHELLADIDDRYVIMNAGDEMAFEFPAPPAPQAGWRRDFVLIGDGWVKDGDFNTAFSKWVRPLPLHDAPDYAGPLTPLESDPAFLRQPDDWRTFHTRYITPRRFQQGLWPTMSATADGEIQP